MIKIDAHQHFWRYQPQEYAWIDASMAKIQRDFLPADLQVELTRTGLDGSVAVQARETLEETRWLLDLAAHHPEVIRGVVGWFPLVSPDLPKYLRQLAENKSLKGVRHLLQAEPDDSLIASPAFNNGISHLLDFQLVYDILIVEHQLPAAITFVDRHPRQSFVLDHIAKPRIARHEIQPWSKHLREIAKRPNIVCKLSGLVTEADHDRWQKQDLRPYLDIVLEAFGPQRLLFGSDWPVCLVATTYGSWVDLVKEQISTLSPSERSAILGGNAQRVYHL